MPHSNISFVNESSVVQQVIYSSEVERVISVVVLSLCTVLALVSHCLIIVTIIKSPNLHSVHYYLIGLSCCADATLVSLNGPHLLVSFISGHPPDSQYCSIVSSVSTFLVLGLALHTGVLAYERYLFFCQPLHYENQMSVTRVSVVIVLCYGLPAIEAIICEMLWGRTFHATTMACYLNDAAVFISLIAVVITLSPSAVMGYSMVQVGLFHKYSLYTK